jgi:Tfp pilus assembly protein PilF
MTTRDKYEVKIFYSYAHKDKSWLEKLEKQLKGSRSVSFWDDRDIIPGANWSDEIDENLNKADIILLLITPDFKDSRFCTTIEVPRALERKRNGEAEVIPILVSSTHWDNPPYKNLQMVPCDITGVNTPIDLWKNTNEACAKAAAEIYRTINNIIIRWEELERFVDDGDRSTSIGKYQEAYNAYKRALGLSPRDTLLYEKLGKVCMRLPKKYTEALEVYEKALNIDDSNVRFWRGKSEALLALGRAIEAKNALSEAIKHDIKNVFLYKEYGDIVAKIGDTQKYQEAIEAYDKAIEAYDKAIELNIKYGPAYIARAKLREGMAKRLSDLAHQDHEKARELGFS